MGEIADALRRARVQREHTSGGGDRASAASPVRAPLEPPDLDGGLERRVEELSLVEVPRDREGFWQARAVVVEDGSAIAQACRQLALRLRAELGRRGARSLVVTSALGGEGKTTVACNIALALASLSRGRDVALVDLDLRRPRVGRVFRIEPAKGIEDALAGDASLGEVGVHFERPALDVFPTRTHHATAQDLLVQGRAANLVAELERTYTSVVFDTPPCLLVPDASLLLHHVPLWVGVSRIGTTRVRSFRKMLEVLPAERRVGFILNEGMTAAKSYEYRYYEEKGEGPE